MIFVARSIIGVHLIESWGLKVKILINFFFFMVSFCNLLMAILCI